MSRSLPTIDTNARVAPGTQVITPMYSDAAVTAGDYIYLSGTGAMGGKGATVGLGLNSTYAAASLIYGYTQTGVSSPTISYSPMFDQGTYTATTRTIADVYQAATNVSTNTTSNGLRSCVLNNGNIVFFYSTSTPAGFYFSIYTPAGVQVKAETNVSSVTPTGGNRSLDVAPMLDGGFVVAYASTSTLAYIRRYDSAGNSLLGQTQAGSGTLQGYISVSAFSNGSYLVCGTSAGASQLRYYVVSSANVVGPVNTPTGATTTIYDCKAVSLTNGNIAIVYNLSNSANYYLIVDSTAAVVVPAVSAGAATTVLQWDACTIPNGFAISYSLSSNSTFYMKCISNGGTNGGAVQIFAGTANSPSICYGGNNTVYATYLSSNLKFSVITNTNGSSTPVVSSNNTVNPAFTQFSTSIANNALDGSIAAVYRNTTSGFVAFQTVNQQTYTQNVTQLTGANYTPATNYYFLGVATNSAAAGGIVNVQMNGVTALPSTYPSVTSPISFDYQNGASPFAQRGTVSGRNIILKGLE